MTNSARRKLLDKIFYPEQYRSLKDDVLACIQSTAGAEEGSILAKGSRGNLVVSCAGHGVRWDLAPSFGEGFVEYVSIADTSLLTIQNFDLFQPVCYRCADSPLVGLGIRAADSSLTKSSPVFFDVHFAMRSGRRPGKSETRVDGGVPYRPSTPPQSSFRVRRLLSKDKANGSKPLSHISHQLPS